MLVGRFALILLGSQHLTKDFDLAVDVDNQLQRKLDAARQMYDAGFCLVTTIAEATGKVEEILPEAEAGVDQLKAADSNIAFFWNAEERIRIDLLFDFPLPTKELLETASTCENAEYGGMVLIMVKATFVLDDETFQILKTTSARLKRPRSRIVRDAICDFSRRTGTTTERERLQKIELLDAYTSRMAGRPDKDVDRELKIVRRARRVSGRRHPAG